MPSSNVVWDIDESVGTLTFNRPHARNALTRDMYESLADACDEADATPSVRVLVIRGAGDAFAAGTDINEFRDFRSDEDAIAYERRLDAADYLSRNDAYPFFQQLGDLLKTGPTGTNVNDLIFLFRF